MMPQGSKKKVTKPMLQVSKTSMVENPMPFIRFPHNFEEFPYKEEEKTAIEK